MAGITSTKKIKGQPHLLAYITPNEVKKLKALGGQETMTKEGIPAYPEYDNYGYSSAKDFKEGNRSKSSDPNVRRDSTFETYRGGKNIGVDNKLKAKYVADRAKKEEDIRKKAALEKQAELAKQEAAKGNYYSPNKNQSFFERTNTKRKNYNRRVKLKNLQRYQRDKINLLNKNLQTLEPGLFYGDTMEKYDDFINMYAPSVTKYGPKGTEKYSQQFIDDVLSGKRPPPKSTFDTGIGSVDFVRNTLDLNVPITKEYLMDLYSGDKNSYIRARDFDVDTATGKEMMKEFEPNRYNLQYGDNNIGGGDGGGQEYLPYIPPEEEDVIDDKTFPYHLGAGGQKVGRDVTLGYLADGGRVPRNMGGIMNVVPRQGYFLGGIGKAIKGVVGGVADAAGKVLKSDLGKMAIAGAAFYYGGGGSSIFSKGAAGSGGFTGGLKALGSNFMSTKNPLLFNKAGELSLGKLFGVSTVLPYLFGEAKPNEDIGMTARGGSLIDPLTGKEAVPAEMRASLNEALDSADGDPDKIKAITNAYAFLGPDERLGTYLPYRTYGVKDGGRIRAQEGGLMNLGGMEKDYRNEGGFVPIGREEKADDVPARLSVNEFVFTADAVRNAGGGDIDKGAEVMENMMKNLENGGTVSEESQGNTGAQEMFSVSERIGEVI